jgi:hypothetical protein
VVEIEGEFMLGNLYWTLLLLFLVNLFVDSFPLLSHPLVFEDTFSAGMPQVMCMFGLLYHNACL